jgi:hypothetical protein
VSALGASHAMALPVPPRMLIPTMSFSPVSVVPRSGQPAVIRRGAGYSGHVHRGERALPPYGLQRKLIDAG